MVSRPSSCAKAPLLSVPGLLGTTLDTVPAQVPYLYFVSNGNGHHRFARSFEEHNRNVIAFRHALQHRP